MTSWFWVWTSRDKAAIKPIIVMIVFVIYILVGRKGTYARVDRRFWGLPTVIRPGPRNWQHRTRLAGGTKDFLQPAAASRRIIIGLFSSVINVGDLLIEAERPARNQELMIYIGRTFPLGIFFLQRQKAMFLEAIICLQCIRRKKDI